MIRQANLLFGAVVTNAAMGVLYVWSLFMLPLEQALGISRGALSVGPAVALGMFTLGMVVHHALLRRINWIGFAIFTFALAGGGFLLTGAIFSYPALLVGYAILFGFGCGSGYGLALALASKMPDARRGLSIGITTASFAISGIVLSNFLPHLIETAGVRAVLIDIGIALLVIGALVCLIIAFAVRSPEQESAAPQTANASRATLGPMLLLGFLFFALCYPGLTFVAHSTGILSEAGVPKDHLSWGPMLLNATYIAGSLTGGLLVQKISAVRALRLSFAILGLGLAAAFFANGSAAALFATGAVGLVFGGSASIMPQVVAERFGAASIGPVYGRLMIGYGLAGLSGPWVSAILFEQAGNYSSALLVALAIAILAGLGTVIENRKQPQQTHG
ncbi:hypothetical protein [Methyloligella solikamskensis]|uniref:Major facilitator superfamily (MFS) profile domain-containing protein n=1 Tax=Methyloligella solikamskensis TaxID=1177756 RepID=A0ABW3J751_9HYPH